MKKLIVCILLIVLAAGIFSVGAGIAMLQTKKTFVKKIIPTPTELPHLDAYKIYDLINDYRASKGLNKLLFDPSMCDFTSKRLTEIHSNFSHKGYKANPFPYGKANSTGENLIQGYTTDQSIVTAWVASPEHLANIVNPQFTRTCIQVDATPMGVFQSLSAVQEFASY